MTTVRDQLADAIAAALAALGVEATDEPVHLERPARRDHGDWSTNVALTRSKAAGRPPRQLANDLAEAMRASPPRHVRAVEVAGPGFVNFRLDDGWLYDVLRDVVESGEKDYARPDLGRGSGSRWSSSRPIRPDRSTSATAGGPPTATPWPGCSSAAATT